MANKQINDYAAVSTPSRTALLLSQPAAGGIYEAMTPEQILETLLATDLPSHTHAVGDITGTLPIANGGTNATTAGDALTSLGAVATTDSRLSDARTPTTHAESHEDGGTDELSLDASQVTSGTLPVARGGTGATTLTGFVQGTGTSALTAAALTASDIPNLSASKITSGTLPVGRGGTGATTLTGIVRGTGTSALTARALASSDLPAGTLKLDAALSSTLQTVEDKAGNESALQISTTGICLLTDGIPLEIKRNTLGPGGGTGASFVRFLDDADTQRGAFGFSSTANDAFLFRNNTDAEEMKFVVTNASSNATPMIRIDGGATNGRLAFFGPDPIEKPTVSGSRGGNAALASLCTALANLGLITDSTS